MSAVANRPIASGLTLPAPRPRPYEAPVGADHLAPTADDAAERRLTITVAGSRWSRPWYVEYIEDSLNSLLVLPAGWDGRRARRVTIAAVDGILQALAAVMTDESAPPQFFPLPDGGVQVEWHIGGNHIEVEVDADGDAHVLAQASDGTDRMDDLLSENQEALVATRSFLQELSARLTRLPPNA